MDGYVGNLSLDNTVQNLFKSVMIMYSYCQK